MFLNPAAFSTPAPGTFGDLERNSIHGPSFRQFDLVVAKKIPFGGKGPNAELRMEVFNLFNIDNFINPAGTLPNASAEQLADRGEQGPARTAVYVRCRRELGQDEQHVEPHGGPGDEPSDSVCIQSELLTQRPA